MIDWLKRDPRRPPTIDVAGQSLPVALRRHPTARRITLRLAPDGSEVRITMPRWGRSADALAFAASRRDWLAAQLAAVPVAAALGHGASLRYRGEALELRHVPTARRGPALVEGAILVGGPGEALASRVGRWLEREALCAMAEDLADYCSRIDRVPPRLALSRAQRRWGSCGPDGTIRINWRLIMAPDYVRRSVVAHEVAHLVHFDHSPRFHALLGELFEGDIKAANAWLKREGRGLYAPFG